MKETPVVDARPRRRNSFGNISKEDLEAKARAAGFDNTADYNHHLYRSDPRRCKNLSYFFQEECSRTKRSNPRMCDICERALVFDCGEKEVSKEDLEAKARAAGFDNTADYNHHLYRSDPRRCKNLSYFFQEECSRTKRSNPRMCDIYERALVFDCGDEKEATGANMREKAAEVALKFKSDLMMD